MARVTVNAQDFRTGHLPPVCAKTGAPADGQAEISAIAVQGWTWILLFWGILPFLIARFASRRRVVGLVPMSNEALNLARYYNLSYWASLVLGVTCGVVGAAASYPVLSWLGVGLLGLAFLLVGGFAWLVWPYARIADYGNDGRIVLSFVHPAFASAVEAERTNPDRA